MIVLVRVVLRRTVFVGGGDLDNLSGRLRALALRRSESNPFAPTKG